VSLNLWQALTSWWVTLLNKKNQKVGEQKINLLAPHGHQPCWKAPLNDLSIAFLLLVSATYANCIWTSLLSRETYMFKLLFTSHSYHDRSHVIVAWIEWILELRNFALIHSMRIWIITSYFWSWGIHFKRNFSQTTYRLKRTCYRCEMVLSAFCSSNVSATTRDVKQVD